MDRRLDIAITKGATSDTIAIRRTDGTTMDTSFPHKGPVPHDAVHWFVERGLGIADGFWGHVAAGLHPEAIAEMAKAAGHASATRARVPDAEIVGLIQAERLVECFEATLWSPDPVDPADFRSVAEAACAASHVALPAIDDARIGGVSAEIAAFARGWMAAPRGHVAHLVWE